MLHRSVASKRQWYYLTLCKTSKQFSKIKCTDDLDLLMFGYCVNSGGIYWIAAVMGHQAGYVGHWLHGNLSQTMLDTECRKQCLYIDLQWIDFFFNLFCHANFSKVYLGYLIQNKEPDSSIQAGLTYVIWVHLPPCEAISITAGLLHRCGILLSLVITMSR